MRALHRWSLAAAAATAAAVASARWSGIRWQRQTNAGIARLIGAQQAARSVTTGARLESREPSDEAVPSPVRRFIHLALPPGHPEIRIAHLKTMGTFRQVAPGRPIGAEEGWIPFSADQVFTVDPPGFVWDARMRMWSFLPLFVRDAYLAGEGSMEAALFGAIPVVDQRGGPELAAGALLRHLAEAAWFPTALLPGGRLRWSPIDDARARATLKDGDVEVSADFEFSPGGDIATVSASRFLSSETGAVKTPWQGRFLAHTVHAGVRVPLRGEVAWFLDGAWRPYWRGTVVELCYDPVDRLM